MVINHAEPFSTALYVADGEEHRVLAFAEVSPTTTTTLPPGEPVATLSQFSGKVEVQIQGGTWMPATPGLQIRAGDRLHTGFKGRARLVFADGLLDLKPMSYVTVGELGARTRILLRLGEVKASVERPVGVPGNYEVSTPTAVASVRGTVFSVLDDPGSQATVVSAEEGVVEVTPTNASLPRVGLSAGQEVQVTSTAVSDVAPIGQAGAPAGGVGRSEARALVLAAVERGADRCRVTIEGTTREAGDAVTLSTFKRGWKATVRLLKLARSKPSTARFTVLGSRVKGASPLAKRVVKCGR